MKHISGKTETFAFLTFFLVVAIVTPSALCIVYPGSYSFDGETGKTGTEITFIDRDDSGSSCLAKVEEKEGDHDEVLKLGDSSGSNIVDINNDFATTQSTGWIEFYVRSDDVSDGLGIRIASGTGESWFDGIFISIQSNNIYFYIDGASNVVVSVSDDTWYKIKVEWDCTTGKWNADVDDVNKVTNADFSYSTKSEAFGGILLQTVGGHSGYAYYIDAVTYSWLGSLPSFLIPTIIGSIAGAAGIAVVVIIIKRRGSGEKTITTKGIKEKIAKVPKAFSREERIKAGKVVPTATRIRGGQVVEEAKPAVSSAPVEPATSSSESRFCPSCGKPAPVGIKICESCGNSIE